MAEKETFNPNKLDQMKFEIFRPKGMSRNSFDFSFGLDSAISNLVIKSSLETGKPIFLQISISFDDNPENKIYSTIFKQNICIIPIAYGFQTSLPKYLTEYKDLQKELADFLRAYPNEKTKEKQELINCYEIVQNIYDKILLSFNNPSKNLDESIKGSVMHLLMTFNRYAPENTDLIRRFVDLTNKLNNNKIQHFIQNGSPKLALSKIKALPIETTNKMINDYGNQITKTLIALLAKSYRDYERNYSDFDNAALATLHDLSLISKQKNYAKLYNDFILDPNNITNQANIDFMNICALAGKFYAFDKSTPESQKGD